MNIKKHIKKIVAVGISGACAVGSALASYTPNYTPADMPNIVTDVLGTGGVEVKVYMPLVILTVLAVAFAGAWYKIKRAF